MGITCKPMGKIKGIFSKLDNQLVVEKQNAKNVSKKAEKVGKAEKSSK